MLVRIVSIAVGLALAVMAASPLPAQGADRPVVSGETGRKLDEYLARLERAGFAGGALAVRGRDLLLQKAYGMANRRDGIPLGTDSVFSLGSITKQFTAAAILTLEMRGRLSVTDLASRHLDGVPADKGTMTIHHLLTHSSGLESDFSPTDFDPVGREEYVRRALASTLLFAPGAGYHYSNAGYSLLAAIVERVSGQGYEEYLAANVLVPAGMRETGYKAPGWPAARVAHGYREGEDWGTILERIQAPDAPYWTLRGNGALHTTLGDMLAWHRALDSGAVLSKAARDKYFKPYVEEGPGAGSFYAYGWAVGRTTRGTAVVQHNGGNGIFVAEFLRFPDEDAMLFLTSTDSGMKATPVVATLERILFGGTYVLPPAVADVEPGALAARAGRWKLPTGGSLTLAVDRRALSAQPDGADAFAALAPSASPAEASRMAAVVARTADISARAFRGDVSGLHEAMARGGSIDDLRRQEADMMRDRESRLGAFKASVVLGAVPREDLVQAFVRLDFEKASVFNVYVWGPARLLGIRGMPQLPALRFVPTSANRFETFSLDPGMPASSMTFEEREGETVLVLGPPGAPVVATRQKRP